MTEIEFENLKKDVRDVVTAINPKVEVVIDQMEIGGVTLLAVTLVDPRTTVQMINHLQLRLQGVLYALAPEARLTFTIVLH